MVNISGETSRHGPEAELVDQFLSSRYFETDHDLFYSIFIEPRVGASSPDIVIVCWDSSIGRNWPKERLNLGFAELRIAHLLFLEGPKSKIQLKKFYPRSLESSIKKLLDSELLDEIDGNYYLIKTLDLIFATKEIIAFEAKISSISKAIEQAHRNTWFASKSYVLTRIEEPSKDMIETANKKGVGLWSFNKSFQSDVLIDPLSTPIPNSFISWYFNDLAWRDYMRV